MCFACKKSLLPLYNTIFLIEKKLSLTFNMRMFSKIFILPFRKKTKYYPYYLLMCCYTFYNVRKTC